MIDAIRQHHHEIVSLCRKYGIKQLDIFGTAAEGRTFSAKSDIDFFFEFDADPAGLADRYFGAIEELEALLGRKVDLVSIPDVHNPHFLQVANRCRTTLYAA